MKDLSKTEAYIHSPQSSYSIIPATHVFERVSRELSLLKQASETLQGEISCLIDEIPEPDINRVQNLQLLDLVTQTTADLENLFNALAALTSSEQVLRLEEATQSLKLLDLANRLNSDDNGLRTITDSQSGECTFF